MWLLLAAVIGIPGYIAEQSDTSATLSVTELAVAGLCLALILILAVYWAALAARYLYLPEGFPKPTRLFVSRIRTSRSERFLLPVLALRNAAISFVLSIYFFALIYKFLSIFYPQSFKDEIDGMMAAIYFSIVTIATVGYGDITPKLWMSRVLVSIEILLGVAFSIFFFSIIASFIRDKIVHVAGKANE